MARHRHSLIQRLSLARRAKRLSDLRLAGMARERDCYRTALVDATEGLTEMLPYIDGYFVEKWDLTGYVERARHSLAVDTPENADARRVSEASRPKDRLRERDD